MTHVTTVQDKRKLSDGQIAVLIQCCDAGHQSWHTLQVAPDTTAEEVTAWVDARKTETAAQHEAMLAADATLAGLI